jgi:hypothetical protein
MKQKQIILIISLLFLFLNGSYAQTQFPDKNGEWYLRYRNPESKSYFQDPFYIEKDTIINELKYSIMRLDGDYFDYKFRAAIRNDYPKVYYINLNHPENNENIMYDFGLKLGDSIELIHFIWPDFSDTAMWYVINVEYQEVNNSQRKVIEIHSQYAKNWNRNIWIEGIGSTMGPVYPLVCSYFEYSYELNCYKENGKRIWGDCSFIDSKQEIKKPIDCYYERSQKRLIIHNFHKDYNLTIHNYLGKLVFSTSDCFDETIDLNWLGKGIYIYTLNLDDRCFSQKFIVEN